ASGNAITEHQYEMVHNDASIGINAAATNDYVRRTIHSWYDGADRITERADYGSGDTATGEGNWLYAAIPSRGTAPTASDDDVLLTTFDYDDDSGRQIKVTNWSDGSTTHTTRTWHDALGRRTYIAKNHDDFSPPSTNEGDTTDKSQDQVVIFQYNGLGKLTSINAMGQNGTTDDQTTTYEYEDSVHADLVTSEIYPDSSSGTDVVAYAYNLDRTRQTRTDQRGTVLTYTYNNRRQLEREGVTTLGGVDNHVRSISRTYDTLARLEKLTSTSAADGTGTVRNEIEYEYNDLNQVTTSYQSHEGSATGSTPKVTYTYDGTKSGTAFTRGHRLEKVTHPSTRSTFYGYNTGTANSYNNRASVVHDIHESSSGGTQYVEYSYTGSGRLATVDYQAPNFKLDRYQFDISNFTKFGGLDRFGRVKDQFWDGYTSTSDVSRVKYGYDYSDSRLWREDVIAANNSKHHDELYTYDGLHRVTDSERGNLNTGHTSITSKNFAEEWVLDNLGNWTEFRQDTDGVSSWDLDQDRTHNAANELDEIDSASTHVALDAAGNMTTVPIPGSWSSHYDLTYDAWNRLVKVEEGENTVATFEYDGLNRRIAKVDVGASDTYDYYYNTNWQVLEVRKDSDTDPLEEYIWHPYYVDAIALRFYDSDVNGSQVDHYYAQDANFNVVAVTNSSGAVQERYKYSAYGSRTVLTSSFVNDSDGISDIANDIAFTGRQFDSETGLYYYRNRYYHAELGRFLGRDPIGYAATSFNLSEYVFGDPFGSTDPSGLARVVIGTIYIIQNGDKYYVGQSVDWKKRLQSLVHPMKQHMSSGKTRISVYPVEADLGSGFGPRRILGTIEQEMIDELEDLDADLVNKIKALTPDKVEATKKVTKPKRCNGQLFIPDEVRGPRGGRLVDFRPSKGNLILGAGGLILTIATGGDVTQAAEDFIDPLGALAGDSPMGNQELTLLQQGKPVTIGLITVDIESEAERNARLVQEVIERNQRYRQGIIPPIGHIPH
ncbi:MAG: hypothetical protein KDB27_16505, partial [Planctomycetales bacterium]|nr:hypothetical protein [Planctomycetales bacterium]